MDDVTKWLKTGLFLPKFMRDFHDQKDLFKALNAVQDRTEEDDASRRVNWATAHVYTIDIFLWMMARHGYTLQKTRKPLAFEPIEDWLEREKDAADKQSMNTLEKLLASPSAGAEGEYYLPADRRKGALDKDGQFNWMPIDEAPRNGDYLP